MKLNVPPHGQPKRGTRVGLDILNTQQLHGLHSTLKRNNGRRGKQRQKKQTTEHYSQNQKYLRISEIDYSSKTILPIEPGIPLHVFFSKVAKPKAERMTQNYLLQNFIAEQYQPVRDNRLGK